MENVMRRLTGLVTEGQVDVHVGRMVNSVDELRRGNWGRLVSTHGPYNSTVNDSSQTPIDTSQPPVSTEVFMAYIHALKMIFFFRQILFIIVSIQWASKVY